VRGQRSHRAAVAAIAAVLAATPEVVSAETATEAGGLRASVSRDPWGLTFEGGGLPALRELRGGGTGPAGSLGFQSGGVWWHATRVLRDRRDGDAYVASLATTDPLGATIELRLAPDSEGVIRLEAGVSSPRSELVTATGVAFEAPPGERLMGFGERSNAVDQRGSVVENYVAEGPYQAEERPFIAAFVPLPGYRPRDDATYYPMPWLLSSRGYGVLLDDDDTSYFRLSTDRPDAWSVEVQAPSIRLRVFAGPRPADVLRRLTARLGRQPAPAAPWYFGPWFQPKGNEVDNIELLRRADAPASVVQTYTHYLPCGDHRSGRDQQRTRTARFHAAGLAVTTYFNPMLCTSYQPVYDRARSEGALTRNQLGLPYEYRYTGASQFLVGQFDFSSPSGVRLFGDLLQEAVDDGYDGWMEDFGEYTPADASSADGTPGPRMHNLYPVLYHRAARLFAERTARPLARFNRSGWTGAARYSQIVWGGDPTTDWGYDGLESAMRNGLTMGQSGVSLWGSAIGGFFSIARPELTPELLIRWIQLGAASGIMRTEANGAAIPPKGRRPQIFDDDVLPVWRRYAKLRTQLYPYLAAAESEYDATGMPIMRHLSLVHPDDAEAVGRDDEFMFGPDLLVAPVTRPGVTKRKLYLPRGRWLDLWRSVAYRPQDGSLLLGRAAPLLGGRQVEVPAPLEELPTMVRAGAVLPLLPTDVQTLTDYGGRGIVHLRDRARRMTLLAFPRGSSTSLIGPGERVRSRETAAGWRLRIRGARRRTYSLQAALTSLARPFRPCALVVGGRRLPRRVWRYSRRSGVLRARFRVRSGQLEVRRRCPRRRR
jgi:sulfoquinovosidase